jgi:hypothetical protein
MLYIINIQLRYIDTGIAPLAPQIPLPIVGAMEQAGALEFAHVLILLVW